MRLAPHLCVPALLAVLLVAAQPSHAAWPTDPATGVPVCTAPGDQGVPRAVTDGAGGILVAWRDQRGGARIYVQRVNATGAPVWTADGIPLSDTAAGDPMIVPDGAGGAIVAWMEVLGLTRVFRAQRVNASGAALWPAEGVTIRSRTDLETETQFRHYYWDFETAAADGNGGMALCFRERNEEYLGVPPSTHFTHVIVVGCDAAGAVAADRMLAEDTYTCNFCGDGFFHMDEFTQLTIAPGGGAGMIIAFRARPIINHFVLFLPPEIRAVGTDAGWAATVVTATADVQRPRVAPDFSGGAIVTWEDTRLGARRAYASRVAVTGALPWGGSGIPLCLASGEQAGQEMTPDGAGGAFVAWLDRRGGGNRDVYAQRVSGAGALQWDGDGVALCTRPTDEQALAVAGCSDGSVAVAWKDMRPGTAGDVYARFVTPLGEAQGTPDGDAVSNAPGDQGSAAIVASASQAVVAWQDHRGGTNQDLYAQLIGRQGPVSGVGTGGEPAGPELRLERIAPNPSSGPVTIRFRLPRAGTASLRLFDTAGRLVRSLAEGTLPAGEHAAGWDGRDAAGRRVRSGLYLVVLEAQGMRLVERVAALR